MNLSNTSRPKQQTLWQTLPPPRQRQALAILAQWTLRQQSLPNPTRNPPIPAPALSKGERPNEPDQFQDQA